MSGTPLVFLYAIPADAAHDVSHVFGDRAEVHSLTSAKQLVEVANAPGQRPVCVITTAPDHSWRLIADILREVRRCFPSMLVVGYTVAQQWDVGGQESFRLGRLGAEDILVGSIARNRSTLESALALAIERSPHQIAEGAIKRRVHAIFHHAVDLVIAEPRDGASVELFETHSSMPRPTQRTLAPRPPTPALLLMLTRLTLGAAWLLHTNWKIAEIEARLGFGDTGAFAHRFHEYFRITPSEFRASRDWSRIESMLDLHLIEGSPKRRGKSRRVRGRV